MVFQRILFSVNDDPIANDDAASTLEDTAKIVSVLPNDSDKDGDTLTLESIETQPSNGAAQVNPTDGTVTYTPDLNYCGPDSFVYKINDGNGGTATATVNVTVNCGK